MKHTPHTYQYVRQQRTSRTYSTTSCGTYGWKRNKHRIFWGNRMEEDRLEDLGVLEKNF